MNLLARGTLFIISGLTCIGLIIVNGLIGMCIREACLTWFKMTTKKTLVALGCVELIVAIPLVVLGIHLRTSFLCLPETEQKKGHGRLMIGDALIPIGCVQISAAVAMFVMQLRMKGTDQNRI